MGARVGKGTAQERSSRSLLSRMTTAILEGAKALVAPLRNNHSDPIVLGGDFAAARLREQERLAAGPHRPSPLAGCSYSLEPGAFDLVTVRELPLDAALRQVVEVFRQQPQGERDEVRECIDMDGLYTLVHFAKRSAVLALNESPSTWLQDGLLALTLVDETRVDQRDVVWAMAILAHSMRATDSDWRALLDGAARAATPAMAALLREGARPSPLTDWGYTQVRHNGLQGLMRWGGARYQPSVDLQALVIRLAAEVDGSRYLAEPQLAVKVPEAWFSNAPAAARVLGKMHAAVTVSGTPTPAVSDGVLDHIFRQWVVDLPSATDASALCEYADFSRGEGGQFIVSCAVGRLFSLVVAGAQVDGLAPIETAETLQTFVARSRRVMAECLEDATRASSATAPWGTKL